MQPELDIKCFDKTVLANPSLIKDSSGVDVDSFNDLLLSHMCHTAVKAKVMQNDGFIKNSLLKMYDRASLKNVKIKEMKLDKSLFDVVSILNRTTKEFNTLGSTIRDFLRFKPFLFLVSCPISLIFSILTSIDFPVLWFGCTYVFLTVISFMWDRAFMRANIRSYKNSFENKNVNSLMNIWSSSFPLIGRAVFYSEKSKKLVFDSTSLVSYHLILYSQMGLNLFGHYSDQKKDIENVFSWVNVMFSHMEKFYLKRDGSLKVLENSFYYIYGRDILYGFVNRNVVSNFLTSTKCKQDRLSLLLNVAFNLCEHEMEKGKSLEKYMSSTIHGVMKEHQEFIEVRKDIAQEDNQVLSKEKMSSFWNMLSRGGF